MGLYKYLHKTWKVPKEHDMKLWHERLIAWRREPATIRIERPTKLARARSLGYKAKQGILVVRQRVPRGGHRRPMRRKARTSKHRSVKMVLRKSYQQVAEERASRHFPNCEVLNSYWVAQDGIYYWYEIIFVDKAHPEILADKNLRWIAEKQHTRRAYRGLTEAARRSRGLMHKGLGAEKFRPSLKSHNM